MTVRQGLYRRRFPRALGPLIPSFRTLVSAAEVAHLLELPSARMKGVPVRRVTIPRIPAPPEIVRGSRPAAPARCPRRAVNASRPTVMRADPRPPRHDREDDVTAPAPAHGLRSPGPEDLYPMLRAENAEVLIHPSDRKYGALLIGGQGYGEDERRMLAGIKKNSNREGVYTQDILRNVKDMGAPLKWISPRSWNYLRTLRASSEIAQEIAWNLRDAADRLDRKSYAAPGARGISALRGRTATLEAIDTSILRDHADCLEQRIAQDVFYLTVERIEEVDYDGWVYDFEIPEHHNFVAGGMLAHNTSALLSFYLNDIEDENAAPIVIDPKSELSRVCLRLTPPDCGKRVWFLDLGRPAFGMSPLRLIGDRPLAIEAAQIADNVVAALLDINENQIYQSSRRYLTHAVIGAIAIANKQGRRARLEDVYTLLRPAKDEFRSAVAEACADQPDLDQTAEFYRSELPDDLRMATSRVAERLDAPRNKISGLTGVPPLRRFFNHPTDVPLREIVQARDILIVDANMGAIGTENSKACMLFILRMLHAQLQRQVHLPEAERPRVPLLVDEAHYVASGENVVDQIATHRAAGLEAAFGLQYFAQLGSASEHQQKILKGVLNLLQSRFLFRMGDAQDAEQATRIAMAVYATMIRDDPDSRARLRVTPEQALNFPNYYCLASWIANGTRAPSFMGQTYPLPDVGDEWAEQHLAAQDERVGPYPEQLESTLASHPASADAEPARAIDRRRRVSAPTGDAGAGAGAGRRPRPRSPDRPAKHEVQVDYEPPPAKATDLADSPVRRVVGRRVHRAHRARGRPAGLGHAARARVPRPDQRDRTRRPARRRGPAAPALRRGLHDPRAARPRRLRARDPDRARRAPRPRAPHRLRPPREALPPRADRAAHHRPARALIQRRQTAAAALADPPRPPGRAAARARAGDLPQTRMEADRATPRRPARARPPRARLGDRVPPRRRRRGHRPLAHPPLRHRPLPGPPSRPTDSAGTRSRSTRSRSPTGRRSSTSSSRRSPRSSPTSRSSSASNR